jgi:hypothetical protein
VPLYSVVESTQRVYGLRLIVVSARTNKRHHHHPISGTWTEEPNFHSPRVQVPRNLLCGHGRGP